jgi:hypothetical protein
VSSISSLVATSIDSTLLHPNRYEARVRGETNLSVEVYETATPTAVTSTPRIVKSFEKREATIITGAAHATGMKSIKKINCRPDGT